MYEAVGKQHSPFFHELVHLSSFYAFGFNAVSYSIVQNYEYRLKKNVLSSVS